MNAQDVDRAGRNQNLAPPSRFPWTKAILVMVMILISFGLQVGVWSLEFLIESKKEASASWVKEQRDSTPETSDGGKPLQSSQRFEQNELYSSKRRESLQHEPVTKSATAYWEQAVASGILDWEYDIDVIKKSVSYQGGFSITPIEGWQALERSAQLGHPRAQLYVGNSVVSGLTFVESVNRDPSVRAQQLSKPVANETTTTPAIASLYWHTSAINYNIESALNMANQIETPSVEYDCSASLPYRAAAAHATIDLLQYPRFSSRIDKHTLYQLHARSTGHTSENRPDESPETLQFFALRAADPNSGEAANAAYTLGRYYHIGVRGTSVNYTAAAHYYRQAAEEGHWAAAGQAGLLYLWGWGVEQNVDTAYELLLKGMGGDDYNVCYWKVMEKLRLQRQQKKSQADAIYLCDDDSLNGMGLLHILGSGPVEVDLEAAEKFFTLARDQGNADAAYNLAMMKLGWKTHYQDKEGAGDTKREATAQELFPVDGKPLTATSPTLSEYKDIMKDLTTAAVQGGHLLAHHRLALLYETGVTVSRKPSNPSVIAAYHVAVKRDCQKAANHYRRVVESAAPGIVKRVRRAYEYYTAGDLANSLKNYLVVAETGHELAQVNAAFLLEQGECLGLSRTDCAKAAVRLWKAAADKGSAEASLRVGDFYYYGRFRDNAGPPFAWVQYILFPEEYLVPWIFRKHYSHYMQYVNRCVAKYWASNDPWSFKEIKALLTDLMDMVAGRKDLPSLIMDSAKSQCVDGEYGEVCQAPTTDQHSMDDDLAVAAQYYRLAAERNNSPRALYNLGFMYQFGLGLKRDFPLAKRQYDLAIVASGRSGEAEVPVGLALYMLSWHERLIKLDNRFQDYWLHLSVPVDTTGQRVPKHLIGKSRLDVVRDHLLAVDSFVMVVLSVALWYIYTLRRARS